MYKLDMPDEEPKMPKFAIISIVVLVVSVIALVLLIGSQRPDSSTQAGSMEFTIVTQAVSAGADTVIGVNNATLYLPAGAIDVPGSLAIFPREPNLFTESGNTQWARPLVVNVEFRDTEGKPVTNITFTKTAEICFKITKDRWADYTRHPDEYQVQTYAEEKAPPVWEPLSMVTHPEMSQLCGQVNHFSLFALATKPETTIPLTDPTQTPVPTETPGNSTGDNKRKNDVYVP
jgi:hypothetical protein